MTHDAKVYLAARSEERAKAAIAELKAETDKEAEFLKLDLSSFESIEAAAKEFTRYLVLFRMSLRDWLLMIFLTAKKVDWTGCITTRT